MFASLGTVQNRVATLSPFLNAKSAKSTKETRSFFKKKVKKVFMLEGIESFRENVFLFIPLQRASVEITVNGQVWYN